MISPLPEIAATCFLTAAVFAAAVTDTRTYRIPNAIVVAILFTGICWQALSGGAGAALLAVVAALLCLACFLPLYMIRAMGAGEVKLIAAVGASLGISGALVAIAGTLTAGALMAGLALRVPGLRQRAATVPDTNGEAGESAIQAVRIPYAAAIAAGTCLALWQQGRFGF